LNKFCKCQNGFLLILKNNFIEKISPLWGKFRFLWIKIGNKIRKSSKLNAQIAFSLIYEFEISGWILSQSVLIKFVRSFQKWVN
jgi:hypothetical protein